MESTGVPGRIHMSRSTYERVHDLGFKFEERDEIMVKGKGKMKTYLLHSKHHLPALEEYDITVSTDAIPVENNGLEAARLNIPKVKSMSGLSQISNLDDYMVSNRSETRSYGSMSQRGSAEDFSKYQ
ncbi:predicted protein [Naegleria gruberi]|uniref:Predicted protein n=1 Tax=Naegleria gruberi TaxID=5762 RepID=D2VR28_NAEGR|nr:uncharacterized protein NAEGRDRAFT_71438 [Naegleria gruberi]EFC40737.1 predicted protein [Naegleria gruberi]|eukprot:XP_002673481.1 predicted protein [Naegleria gruberi strain NEG-M]